MIQDLPAKSCFDLREADPGIVHIDARSETEFLSGRAAGAWNVPYAGNPRFLAGVSALAPERARRVVVDGDRAACAALEAAGWTLVVWLRGGFAGSRDAEGRLLEPGWEGAGLPVERGDGPRDWPAVSALVGNG
ncbi:MAG: rhodanese-like domain-containing protein [Planctomycetota bacterium]